MRCLQIFWRLIGPTSGAPFSCALYRLRDGSLELRAGQGEQDPLLRQRFDTEAAAEMYADAWRAAAEAKGFRDLDQAGSSGTAS
jgi:hypothetical protein